MENWIKEIAKQHERWVAIMKSFGADYYAEDLVQEMYITLNRTSQRDKCFRDGEVYVGFIYTCLKNTYINYLVKKQRVTKVDVDEYDVTRDDIDVSTETVEQKKEFEELSNQIRELLNNEHWYLEKVYDIYTSPEDPSYRDMARETNISFMTIYGDMKKIKHLIIKNKHKFEKAWQELNEK